MWKKYIVTFCPVTFFLVTFFPMTFFPTCRVTFDPVTFFPVTFFRLPFMHCIYIISFIGRDVRKSNIDYIEISCPPMKIQTIICISDYW
jgi:hypothetical protein